MKHIFVCRACGSPRVVSDAWVDMNTGETQVFDQKFCHDCDGETKASQVQVEDGFDLDKDFYKEAAK